jgi:DNA-binding NtrC family response regulator
MNEKTHSLLIIDDDENTLESMEKYFQLRGYEVTSTSNGLDALKIIEKRSDIDLIITDIVMPSVSGIAVISVAKKFLPDVPLIAITGWGEHPEGLAWEAQADVVVKKPVQLEKLENEVLKLLQQPPADLRA